MTPGKRWRARRDLTIAAAYLGSKGLLSHRILADVFDLSRARVGQILGPRGLKSARRRGQGGDGPGVPTP